MIPFNFFDQFIIIADMIFKNTLIIPSP
jgi:hypothetical protein